MFHNTYPPLKKIYSQNTVTDTKEGRLRYLFNATQKARLVQHIRRSCKSHPVIGVSVRSESSNKDNLDTVSKY